MGQKLAKGKT